MPAFKKYSVDIVTVDGFAQSDFTFDFNRSTVIFYFFVRLAKNITIENQHFTKYFKNNC